MEASVSVTRSWWMRMGHEHRELRYYEHLILRSDDQADPEDAGSTALFYLRQLQIF